MLCCGLYYSQPHSVKSGEVKERITYPLMGISR